MKTNDLNIIQENFMNNNFFSLEEAAEYLKISKATLYNYTSTRKILHFKVCNRKIYFKKEDLDNFIFNKNNLVTTSISQSSKAITDIVIKDISDSGRGL